jgi:hypothetical protein
MKYPHSIPLWRTNGEVLPGNALSRVVLSSVGTKWNDVVVEQQHWPSPEVADVMYKGHVIAVTVGHSTTWEFKKEGRFQRFFKARGAIGFYPSHQPFSCRAKVESGVFADALFVALNPVLVRRVAEGLELDLDRIELIEQRRSTDPTLHHIAMALRAGVQTGAALTACMERHYQQLSPFTSYANIARQCSDRKSRMVGCRTKSWSVLSNIFKIN